MLAICTGDTNVGGIRRAIIELPMVMHSPGGHGALLGGAITKLFYCVGLYGGLLAGRCYIRVGYIPVHTWKGQLPKQLTTQRVNRKYHTTFNWRTKEHNIADAVALGDWYLTKSPGT